MDTKHLLGTKNLQNTSFTELKVICSTAEGWGLANIWSYLTLLGPVMYNQNDDIQWVIVKSQNAEH
jgi:hypothetical protein